MKIIPQSVIDRVKATAQPFSGDGCWHWPKYRNPVSGYGQLSSYVNGKRALHTAHRASYVAFVEQIPPGLCVLHKCDNPACFNPAHLFLGTMKDNTADMWRKGRQQDYTHQPKGDNHPSRRMPERLPRGSANNKAKLTEAQVREIRLSNLWGAEIARRYGISHAAVSQIIHGGTWKHVDPPSQVSLQDRRRMPRNKA